MLFPCHIMFSQPRVTNVLKWKFSEKQIYTTRVWSIKRPNVASQRKWKCHVRNDITQTVCSVHFPICPVSLRVTSEIIHGVQKRNVFTVSQCRWSFFWAFTSVYPSLNILTVDIIHGVTIMQCYV